MGPARQPQIQFEKLQAKVPKQKFPAGNMQVDFTKRSILERHSLSEKPERQLRRKSFQAKIASESSQPTNTKQRFFDGFIQTTPSGSCQEKNPERMFPSGGSQTKVPKRKIASDKSQASDRKRKIQTEDSNQDFDQF